MEKSAWFKVVITTSFLVTLALELYAIRFHQFTVSDFILENVRMKWRVAILAWLVYHFLFEYPHYR